MEEKMTFEEHRKKRGITQKYVAEQLGMSQASLCRKEKCQRHFTINEVAKLLDIYGIEFKDIIIQD